VLRLGLEPEAEHAELSAIAAAASAAAAAPVDGEAGASERAPEAAGEAAPEPLTAEALRADALVEIADRSGTSLDRLEAWLAGETHPSAVVALLAGWALEAAGLDLDRARHEAKLYIDAYPFEGRVVGNVPERCARWLAQRTAMFATPADQLPPVRRAALTLAEAAEPDHPATAASLRAAAAEASDDDLWYGLCLEIAETEMQKVNRGKRR
jgi:hypothetical protein